MNTNKNTNSRETWKDIKGFEGDYQVSNLGNVRCLHFNHTKGRVQNLRPQHNTQVGYLYVTLSKSTPIGRVSKVIPIHRLVAEAFLPNPNNYEQVDHKDNCRTRNCVSNLRWISRKANNSRKHARYMKSMNNSKNTHQGQIIRAWKWNETTLETDVKFFNNGIQAAKELGCSHVLVYYVLNPNHFARTARGWKLKWVDIPEANKEVGQNG